MANIIMANDYSIRTTQFAINETYDINDLTFYIDNNFNSSSIYITLTDECGTSDIIPLKYYENRQSYKIYKIDCKNNIRVKPEKVSINILLYSENDVKLSNNIDVKISFDNYMLSHQFYITKEVSNTVNTIYEKIVDITNINIDLYDKIVKVAEKYDYK